MPRSYYGIILFSLAMLLVPGMDALSKLLTQTMSPGQATLARFLLQLPFVFVIIFWRGQVSSLTKIDVQTHLVFFLRGFFLAVATTCFFVALSKMKLADAIAIFLLEPMILTILSSLILKEKVGWQQVFIILLGLIGALLVIRPSYTAIGLYALLPLGAAFAFALYLLVTRFLMSDKQGSLVVHFYTNVAGVVTTLCIVMLLFFIGDFEDFVVFSVPTAYEWYLLFGLTLVGMASHLILTVAFRYTMSSTLAPLQYIEIVSATILGYLIFKEIPSLLSWVGIFLIVFSGLLVYLYERKKHTQHINTT